MFSLKKAFSFAVVLAMLFVSCVPEDGEAGPAGPIGPEGQIGPAGTDGTIGRDGNDGTDGKDGVDGGVFPVVMTYIVDSLDWVAGAAPKVNVDITQDVVDNGMVLAYRTPGVPGPNSVWTGLYDGTFNYSYETGTVTFLTPGFTGANFITYFKVVVLPSVVRIDGFNPETYEEAKMVYNFED